MPQLYESFWSWTWNKKLIIQFYADNINSFTATFMGVKKVDKSLTAVLLLELCMLDSESNMYALYLET